MSLSTHQPEARGTEAHPEPSVFATSLETGLSAAEGVKNKGFSLIEVVVVLTIIALSVALMKPSFSRFLRSVELKATAKRISSILRYCRSEAVNTGQVYQVLFDADHREVKMKQLDSAKSSPKTYSLPEGINLKEVDAKSSEDDSDIPAIEFYPSGGSNGGTIVLDQQEGTAYKIKVHFLTGVVEIEKG